VATTRIRGQETTGQLVVDGKLLLGSFAKLENWAFKPISDIKDSDFVGEAESEFDVQHHGWEVSFTIHEQDGQAMQTYLQIVAALEAGIAMPNFNFVVIESYRDPSVPLSTYVCQDLKLKLDEHAASGRKEYVKNSFTGKCKVVRKL